MADDEERAKRVGERIGAVSRDSGRISEMQAIWDEEMRPSPRLIGPIAAAMKGDLGPLIAELARGDWLRPEDSVRLARLLKARSAKRKPGNQRIEAIHEALPIFKTLLRWRRSPSWEEHRKWVAKQRRLVARAKLGDERAASRIELGDDGLPLVARLDSGANLKASVGRVATSAARIYLGDDAEQGAVDKLAGQLEIENKRSDRKSRPKQPQ